MIESNGKLFHAYSLGNITDAEKRISMKKNHVN